MYHMYFGIFSIHVSQVPSTAFPDVKFPAVCNHFDVKLSSYRHLSLDLFVI